MTRLGPGALISSSFSHDPGEMAFLTRAEGEWGGGGDLCGSAVLLLLWDALKRRGEGQAGIRWPVFHSFLSAQPVNS